MFAQIKFELKNIIRTFRREGPIPSLRLLAKDMVRFLTQYIFDCRTLYLYEHTMRQRDESRFRPKIENAVLHIVSSNEEADNLARQYEDFRDHIYYARHALDRGAIAFCIYVDGAFAHIGWVAFTEEAKNTFDRIAYQVDFSNREACTGGTLTLPRFRGKGLMTYSYFKRQQFLFERGMLRSRNAVRVNNIASQRAQSRFKPRIHAKVRFIRFLKWEFLYRISDELHC